MIPWKPVPACLRLVVSTLGHEKNGFSQQEVSKNAHNFQGAFGGTLWDYQHQIIKQFSSNARRCFKALYLFGYFLAAPGHPTTIDRDPPTLVFQHQKAQLDGWSRSQMNRGSRLQCPTKVDGWNGHDLQGDICDVTAKVDGWKGCSFSLCKHEFQVLSFCCLLQIQHNLLSPPALQKKKCPLSLPGGPLPYKSPNGWLQALIGRPQFV